VIRVSDSRYEYLIEIFSGLIGRLLNIFTRCALHPDFPYRKKFVEAGLLTDEKARDFLPLVLLNLAISFVTLHEFAHLITGHLSLLKAIGSVEALDESPDPRLPQGVSFLDRQTLETNADATAAILLVSQTLNQKQYAQTLDMPWFKSSETSIELMFFSIITFFWASGVRLHDLEALDEAAYPPNTLRERMVVRSVCRYIEHRLPERRGDKTPILKEPPLQIAQRAAEILDKFVPFDAEQLPPLEELLSQTNDARLEKHVERIGENWQVLAKRLETLKHGGNLRTGKIVLKSPSQIDKA
jgi:hypothetical protein